MFKILTKGCEPKRASKNSACIDLFASEDCVIGAGETKFVGIGVAIDIEKLFMAIYDIRYEMAAEMNKYTDVGNSDFQQFELLKKSFCLQLTLHKNLGIKGIISNMSKIGLDFKDEIKIIIHNPLYDTRSITTDDFNSSFKIKKGDKVAQITLIEHKNHLLLM